MYNSRQERCYRGVLIIIAAAVIDEIRIDERSPVMGLFYSVIPSESVCNLL